MLNSHPTNYPELNGVLADLVTTAEAILGDNFCGAYLVGSFAVGDADPYSDVDFLIVTLAEITDDQLVGLRAMHVRFPTEPIAWAQHLEGSYIPRASLRHLDPSRAPHWYVDNGSPDLERSNHDNTAVVRWVLREHGICLAGPEPTALVDVVTAEDLRREIHTTLTTWDEELHADYGDGQWSAWLQPHVVLAYCRMLHTLSTSRVGSKRAAGLWALTALDTRWAPLIQQALDDRSDPWLRVHRPADSLLVARTWEFVAFALQWSRDAPS
jgi:hypothetical protein